VRLPFSLLVLATWVVFFLGLVAAHAEQPQTTFRDAGGRTTGTASTPWRK
jgi:hypothetical protein